jgi:hypothetical protein
LDALSDTLLSGMVRLPQPPSLRLMAGGGPMPGLLASLPAPPTVSLATITSSASTTLPAPLLQRQVALADQKAFDSLQAQKRAKFVAQAQRLQRNNSTQTHTMRLVEGDVDKIMTWMEAHKARDALKGSLARFLKLPQDMQRQVVSPITAKEAMQRVLEQAQTSKGYTFKQKVVDSLAVLGIATAGVWWRKNRTAGGAAEATGGAGGGWADTFKDKISEWWESAKAKLAHINQEQMTTTVLPILGVTLALTAIGGAALMHWKWKRSTQTVTVDDYVRMSMEEDMANQNLLNMGVKVNDKGTGFAAVQTGTGVLYAEILNRMKEAGAIHIRTTTVTVAAGSAPDDDFADID